MVSATDSVLTIADTVKKGDLNYQDVSDLFKKYNYSDVIVNSELNYVGKGVRFGVRPVRYQGQFFVHNPNLPLVSLAVREDVDVLFGLSKAFEFDSVRFTIGATADLLFRKDNLAEASLVDLAIKPAKELLDRQNMTGYFFDIGTELDIGNFFTISTLTKDLGDWFKQKRDNTYKYLFLYPDRIPRTLVSASIFPALGPGRFQIGASSYYFHERENQFSKQWFGTISYYVGPLRLLSGFRDNLFRTGIATKFSRFEVNVAQEWFNTIETGRKSRPRFTLEVTTSL